MTKVAITGAAGNLGGLLSRGLKDLDIDLNLLIHKKDVSDDNNCCTHAKGAVPTFGTAPFLCFCPINL